MIDPAFWKSETIGTLPLEQRYLFIGLFSNADDQGRLRGHPGLVRNDVFPFDSLDLEKIQLDLDALVAIDAIHLYEVDGTAYIQIVNWWAYQHPRWAWPSEYPSPEGWRDRICCRKGNTVIKENWDNPDASAAPDSVESGATMEPERGQSGATVEPAPSTRGSNSTSTRVSDSTNNNKDPAATAPDVVAAVDPLECLTAFGMHNPETVLSETGLSPPQIVDTVRYAEDEGLGAGWVRTQLRENTPYQPRAPDDGAARRRSYAGGAYADYVES